MRTITVDVDVDINEFDDNDLIAELEDRGYSVGTDKSGECVQELEKESYIVVDSDRSVWLEEIRDELKRLLRDYRSDIVYEKLKQL